MEINCEQLKHLIDKMITNAKVQNPEKQADKKFLESLPDSLIIFLKQKNIDVEQMLIQIPRFIRLKPGFYKDQRQLAKQMEIEQDKIIRIDKQFFALQPSVKINNTQPYQKAKIYGMDICSAMPVRCLNALPNQRVLEICGAPGNKSMYLADRIQNIQITSVQINENRAQVMKSLINKYGLADKISLVIADGTKYKSQKLFDRVLVDAECTHEGSVKHIKKFMKNTGQKMNKTKKKEKKWLTSQQEKQFEKNNSNIYTSFIMKPNQWSEKDFENRFLDPLKLKNLEQLQINLLENGFNLLKEGGILVYSTCSYDKQQNQNLVQKFCHLKSLNLEEFFPQIIDASDGLESSLGYERCQDLNYAIKFNPKSTRTGGMFVCKLTKKKSSHFSQKQNSFIDK